MSVPKSMSMPAQLPSMSIQDAQEMLEENSKLILSIFKLRNSPSQENMIQEQASLGKLERNLNTLGTIMLDHKMRVLTNENIVLRNIVDQSKQACDQYPKEYHWLIFLERALGNLPHDDISNWQRIVGMVHQLLLQWALGDYKQQLSYFIESASKPPLSIAQTCVFGMHLCQSIVADVKNQKQINFDQYRDWLMKMNSSYKTNPQNFAIQAVEFARKHDQRSRQAAATTTGLPVAANITQSSTAPATHIPPQNGLTMSTAIASTPTDTPPTGNVGETQVVPAGQPQPPTQQQVQQEQQQKQQEDQHEEQSQVTQEQQQQQQQEQHNPLPAILSGPTVPATSVATSEVGATSESVETPMETATTVNPATFATTFPTGQTMEV